MSQRTEKYNARYRIPTESPCFSRHRRGRGTFLSFGYRVWRTKRFARAAEIIACRVPGTVFHALRIERHVLAIAYAVMVIVARFKVIEYQAPVFVCGIVVIEYMVKVIEYHAVVIDSLVKGAYYLVMGLEYFAKRAE